MGIALLIIKHILTEHIRLMHWFFVFRYWWLSPIGSAWRQVADHAPCCGGMSSVPGITETQSLYLWASRVCSVPPAQLLLVWPSLLAGVFLPVYLCGLPKSEAFCHQWPAGHVFQSGCPWPHWYQAAGGLECATEPLDISVSFDGIWHKHRHTSLYGLGAVIDILTVLVLDHAAVSKYWVLHAASRRMR